MIIAFLLLTKAFAGALICNDGTQSPTCDVCSSGCCSYHGGCDEYEVTSRHYSHAAASALSASKDNWVISSAEIPNFTGVVRHDAAKFGEKVGLFYSCLLDSDQTPLFTNVTILVDSATGCWSSEVGKKFSVSIGDRNSATTIKSWEVDCRDDKVLLSKIMSTGKIFESIPNQLVAAEVKLFRTAEYIRFTVNETAYSLSLAGSAAAIAATDAACNR